MESLGKKIRMARFNADLDQKELANIIGVSKEYISYWENDKRIPAYEHIIALSKTLNKTPNYFLGFDDDATNIKETSDTVSLRMAGEVSCGSLTYATSENGEYITEELPISFFSKYGNLSKRDISENYFILQAKGDSMSPYIEDRDQLICKRVQDVDSGKIGVVVSPDSEATVKIISKNKDKLTLIPINKRHEEQVYTYSDGDFRIIAEVIYVIRRVRTFII